MTTEEAQVYLEAHAKLTTTKCLQVFCNLHPIDNDELMKDFRSIGMSKKFPVTYKGVMRNLHGHHLTDEELTWSPVYERFYTLMTNDIAGYVGQEIEEGRNPIHDLQEDHYGMPKNVFCLALLLEVKLLRHDQVRVILKDLFTAEVCGLDIEDYLASDKAQFLNEPEVDLLAVVREVLAANPDAAADYKKGKEKALGRLMGAVLKKVKGSPQEIQELIKAELKRS